MHVSADRDAQLRVPGQQRSHRRALMAGASAVAAGLLLVAAVASFRGQVPCAGAAGCALRGAALPLHPPPSPPAARPVRHCVRVLWTPPALAAGACRGRPLTCRRQQGPIEDKSAAPQIAQTAIPNGKFYLMKMIRRQVAMKQRQAKEKAEHLSPLKVHIMRSYKQVLADKMAHPAGSKSKLKALAEAKLKKAKVLLRSRALRAAAACDCGPACASNSRFLTTGRRTLSHPNSRGCSRRPRTCARAASRWKCCRRTGPSPSSCSSRPRPTTSSLPCKQCRSTR